MRNKRKNEGEKVGGVKRVKSSSGQATSTDQPASKAQPNHRPRIRKLAPPRPFPSVAPASSATGPRSAHHEGKNNICITRRTKLAAYLRRCKAFLVDDGFKELKLSAMGAAIPHLALLAVSLPPILPWAESEVHVDVFTGSLEVRDEVLSESGSEADDNPQEREEFRTRVKSTMNVIIRIGQGDGPAPLAVKNDGRPADGGKEAMQRKQIVLDAAELEQDNMEAS